MSLETRSALLWYVVKRILLITPTFFLMVILLFILVHIAPGDPVYILAGEYGVSEEYLDTVRHEYGLDKPLYEQLLIYISNVVRGNLGYSFIFKERVLSIILARMPPTILLMGTQWVASAVIGIILGVTASRKIDSKIDHLITGVSVFGYSIPVFWLAQVLILLFSVYLGWFPVTGMASAGKELTWLRWALDVLHHLILPVVSLSMLQLALVSRLVKTGMLDVLKQDYITMARSVGFSQNIITFKYGLKNAMIPVVTILGMNFGRIFGGSVIVETIFAWPGVGRLVFDSVMSRDSPMLMGLLIVYFVMILTANLITDLLYAYLDPRIRYRARQ